MKKQKYFQKYGLGQNRLNTLFLKFGFSSKIFSFNDNILEAEIEKFLDLSLDKKEFLLKKNHLIFLKQLESGSFRGYKRIRGLPCRGQRTKTNAKINRLKKK